MEIDRRRFNAGLLSLTASGFMRRFSSYPSQNRYMEIKETPSRRPIGFAHNSANDLETLKMVTSMGIRNVEVDPRLNRELNMLYVSHDEINPKTSIREDFEQRSLSARMSEIGKVARAVNVDIKLSDNADNYEKKAMGDLLFEQFDGTPAGLKVIISGNDWGVLLDVGKHPRVARTFFTIQDESQIADAARNADYWRSKLGKPIGVSINRECLTHDTITELKRHRYSVLVWSIDSLLEAENFAALGVWGETINSPGVLKTACTASLESSL